MNDRLEDLMYESGLTAQGCWDSMDDYDREAIEKFADLIVEECIRYFNEDYKRDFDTLWREDLTKGIKQHFGVKE
jgi:hypothetical protein